MPGEVLWTGVGLVIYGGMDRSSPRAGDREVWTIEFAPLPGVPSEVRIRRLLKYALRVLRLRATSVAVEPEPGGVKGLSGLQESQGS